MFDELLKGLANQGAMGTMLALLLLIFVRFFNKTFDAQTERDRAHYQFMQQCLTVLQEIKSSFATFKSEITSSVNARLGDVEERVLDAVRDLGSFVVAENRRDNDLSRPLNVTPGPVPMQPYAPATEPHLKRAP